MERLFPPESPFPESRFITIDEITIHYRTYDPGSDVLGKVVLLHGVGGSTFSFQRIAPLLAQAGYAVLSVDQPGFGFSDPATAFVHSPENRAALLWHIMERLDGEDPAFEPTEAWSIVGHSIGAQAAVELAREQPARVKSLALVAAALVKESFPLCCYWFPPVRWGMRSWLANSVFTEAGVRELLADAYGREPSPEEIDGYLGPLVRPGAAHGVSRFLETSTPWNPALEAIVVPTLVIWGSQDSWIEPEIAESIAQRIADSRLEFIEGAGHSPLETHTEATLPLLLEWFEAPR